MFGELGIIDTRKIISTLQDCCGVDYSEYATTSLKRRFYNALELTKIGSVETFIESLRTDSSVRERFLFDISVDSTEMFRDPSVWRKLRKMIFPKIPKNGNYRIWFPDANSGEEVYTLSILLDEEGLLDSVKMYASNISSLKTEFMKRGSYKPKREDSNTDNYVSTGCKYTFNKYYTLEGVNTKMNPDLLRRVEYINAKSLIENAPKDINLVIFRNSMIYLNRAYQNIVVNSICNNMVVGGYLLIGIQENLNSILAEKKFNVIDNFNKIYQKITK